MFIFRRGAGSGCISIILAGIFLINFLLLSTVLLFAHDKHYAVTPQQKAWFNSLKSGKGPCCSDADGSALSDLDWESVDGHYRVRIDGKWIDVPDEAVLKQPNLYGPTMVWPIYNRDYSVPNSSVKIEIRCFIPGLMT